MKPGTAANGALALALISCPLLFYGFFSMMGDPPRSVPQAEIDSRALQSGIELSIGLIFLTFALWLSGYAFSATRWRSMLALLICLVPVASIVIGCFT